MSHWLGCATNYSRKVEGAYEALRTAQDDLLETLRTEYPLGAHVLVTHHRGSFSGVVAGWDWYGARVLVKNDRTGKTGKWWAAHVGIAPSN